MMFRVEFLLCIAIGVHSVTGQATPKLIEFTCDNGDGKITVYLDHNTPYKSLYAVGTTLQGDGTLCNVTDLRVDKQGTYEITGCQADKLVTITLMKISNQNQERGRTDQHESASKPPKGFIVGGQDVLSYTLKCFKETAVDDNGKIPHNFVVTKMLSLTTQSPNTVQADEYGAILDMIIVKEDYSQLTGAVTIGQTLLVVISGPAGPWYRVQECSAYERTRDDQTAIKLVKNSKAVDEMTKALMTDFTAVNTTSTNWHANGDKVYIRSTLHAFRFRDSNSVTIECAIEVCKSQTSDQMNCTTENSFRSQPAASGRRRRETGNSVHVLKSTMLVNDHLDNNRVDQKSSGDRHESSYRLALSLPFLWIVGSLICDNLLM